MATTKKKSAPDAAQNLKLYSWGCSWADGGSLMILARSLAEARMIARERAAEREPYQGAVATIVKEKPEKVLTWPCVVSA